MTHHQTEANFFFFLILIEEEEVQIFRSNIIDLITAATIVIKIELRMSRGPGSTAEVASELPNCPIRRCVSWFKRCNHTSLCAQFTLLP